MIRTFFVTMLVFSSATALANEMYRKPSSGDKGTYYIVESEPLDDGTIRVLSSRVGKGGTYTDFTELKVNCKTKQYFELAGSSEDGDKKKPTKPLKEWSGSKWVSLVAGSSKSDLVSFVCKKSK